jgi:hypothetical protein
MPRFVRKSDIIKLTEVASGVEGLKEISEAGKPVYLVKHWIDGWREVQAGDFVTDEGSIFTARTVKEKYERLD